MQGGALSAVRQEQKSFLGPIERSFQGGKLPTGVIHEFVSNVDVDAAATNGFIAGLLGQLICTTGNCLWISTRRTIYPPALKLFGIDPDRIIFIDVASPSDALWVVEEALRCNAVAAVVGEIKELGFTESRRLQLAAEQSGVTGFVHRYQPRSQNVVACVTRWQIKSMASTIHDDMPGVGYPRWEVQLTKVRNGKPGTWQVEWESQRFRCIPATVLLSLIHI